MPYIKQALRNKFLDAATALPDIENKGELEFLIFYLMLHYMKDKEYNYDNLHTVVYSAIHAAEEFKRRFLDKREDQSLEKNGDIFC